MYMNQQWLKLKNFKMARIQCVECPWKVKNSNNTSITEFSNKHNKQHNCHMISRDLWNINKKHVCIGSVKPKQRR